jgi:hypothetical protein
MATTAERLAAKRLKAEQLRREISGLERDVQEVQA